MTRTLDSTKPTTAATAKPIVLVPGRRELNPARAARIDRRVTNTLAVLIPLLLIGSWELAAQVGAIDARFFPAPTTIIGSWGESIADGTYWTHLGVSAQRIVLGYLFGTIPGIIAGLLIGRARLVGRALEPTIIALYTIPKLAILPLLLLVFGIGETPKLVLIGITTFWIVLINTTGALEEVQIAHIEAGRSFGLSKIEMIRHIVLPSAAPQIFTGLRIAAGMAVLALVGAEFVAAKAGLGYMIWNSWNIGIPSFMYIGIISISILGVLTNTVLRLLQRAALPWDR
ncbi:ABC transporter permease [Streptosporangium sp. NPDC002544]|uniref:ABC transporter permease n=1 Tax=unclassified Streptosporangium TaxID=2632669 RepID=UPI00331AFDA7